MTKTLEKRNISGAGCSSNNKNHYVCVIYATLKAALLRSEGRYTIQDTVSTDK
jgi:hypothetical protein